MDGEEAHRSYATGDGQALPNEAILCGKSKKERADQVVEADKRSAWPAPACRMPNDPVINPTLSRYPLQILCG